MFCHLACSSADLVSQGHCFKIFPLEDQMIALFSRRDIHSVIAGLQDKPTDETALDTEYKCLLSGLKFPHLIILTCNTDGIPVFSSPNASLCPVFFIINELPLAVGQKSRQHTQLVKHNVNSYRSWGRGVSE